jgi:hypothetical protein
MQINYDLLTKEYVEKKLETLYTIIDENNVDVFLEKMKEIRVMMK